MKDRDNEDEVLKHFCFVLAVKEGKEGVMRRIKVLEPSEIVIQFFSQAYTSAYLLVHTVKQNHKLQGEKGNEQQKFMCDIYCIVLAYTNFHVCCLCTLPNPNKWTVETCAQNCVNTHFFAKYRMHRNIQEGAAHFPGSGQAVSRGVSSQLWPVACTEDTEPQTSWKEETSCLLQPG